MRTFNCDYWFIMHYCYISVNKRIWVGCKYFDNRNIYLYTTIPRRPGLTEDDLKFFFMMKFKYLYRKHSWSIYDMNKNDERRKNKIMSYFGAMSFMNINYLLLFWIPDWWHVLFVRLPYRYASRRITSPALECRTNQALSRQHSRHRWSAHKSRGMKQAVLMYHQHDVLVFPVNKSNTKKLSRLIMMLLGNEGKIGMLLTSTHDATYIWDDLLAMKSTAFSYYKIVKWRYLVRDDGQSSYSEK